MVAETVWIATIVQTDLILAMLPIVTRIADAPRYRKLHGTMTSMRTVVVAVPYATIIINEGRRALARPEAVTNTVRFAERPVLPMRREGTRHPRNVHLVFIMLSMIVPRLAAVLADLFVRVLVDITEVARTADVGTVRPIITAVALAEAIRTVSLIITVVRTIMNTQPPHVI